MLIARWNNEKEAHLLSRAMSSFAKSRTATSTGTLTAVRPGNPGKGRDTVITPPSTESLVVAVTALDGWGRELKVRPTRTSPWAGEAASLRKLWFHGTVVTRLPVRACLATSGVLFLLRPLLCTNRRSSAVERLTAALEQTLEHMGGSYLFAPMQAVGSSGSPGVGDEEQRVTDDFGATQCAFDVVGRWSFYTRVHGAHNPLKWWKGAVASSGTVFRAEMVSSCVFASFAAASVVGVGAFHVPVLPSTRAIGEARAAVANNGHVSRMSAADDKSKSFYPFLPSKAPSTRCVV